MCGIAGMMSATREAPRAEVLAAMGAALTHRGPDGTGHYASGQVAFVHNRLSIIDLATGDQPIREPGGAALVANAEFYNFVELRAELDRVNFRTRSDCEPPLHVYRRDGVGFATSLRGMWAAAIHDPQANRLVLTRDPFGIKPLYYAETDAGVACASEAQALCAAGFGSGALDESRRDEMLALQFTTGHETIFRGIQRVMPGETIVIAGGRIVERQRRNALPEGAPHALTDSEALSQLDRVFEDSVRVHQRSDVPYGMFLSGGIDSSAVLAMMARLNDRAVQAYTAYFPGGAVADERDSARAVARSCGAELHEVSVTADAFFAELPAIAAAMDDPAADYAIVPTWLLARRARGDGLKVVLSGEGGDELFGGYGRYRSVMRPWWLGGRAMRRRGHLDGLGILRHDSAAWRDGIEAAGVAARQPDRTRLQIAQAVDCADWLPNDLLTKLDRCLMAHGVEGRTPFLDPVVASFAYRLPDLAKIRDGLGKWLLRQWLANHVPDSLPFARKRGFTVPVADWIRGAASRLAPLIERQACIRALAKPGAVDALFRRGDDKRAGFAMWLLLFYALWYRRHGLGLAAEGDVFHALDSTPTE
jgi:asparagine synthase (glutamine-hydrolysing)